MTDDQPDRLQAIGSPLHSDGSPNYQYLDCGRWWDKSAGILSRGWVRNARFGAGDVIPGGKRKGRS